MLVLAVQLVQPQVTQIIFIELEVKPPTEEMMTQTRHKVNTQEKTYEKWGTWASHIQTVNTRKMKIG